MSYLCVFSRLLFFFFFFNHPATTEIYTLSLHDALPIWRLAGTHHAVDLHQRLEARLGGIDAQRVDRKSTRLNSSHLGISYAVFCLKKKKKKKQKKIRYKKLQQQQKRGREVRINNRY